MNNQKIKEKGKWSVFGSIKLSFYIFIVFLIGLIPFLLLLRFVYIFINLNIWWHWFLLPVAIYFLFTFLLYGEIIFSGLIIKIFKIRYKEGEYIYSYKDKNSFKWIIICSIYTPVRKFMEIFIVGRLKNAYYKMLGMKIGKNTLVGGVIKDPCMTVIGDNTTMGEYAIIYGHIHNYEKGTINIKKIKIGNNCIIGAGSIIMPGVTIQDDVVVAAGAVIPQNKVLLKGKTYAGIPAKQI